MGRCRNTGEQRTKPFRLWTALDRSYGGLQRGTIVEIDLPATVSTARGPSLSRSFPTIPQYK